MRGLLVMAMFAASLAGAGSAGVTQSPVDTDIAAGSEPGSSPRETSEQQQSTPLAGADARLTTSETGQVTLLLAREHGTASSGC